MLVLVEVARLLSNDILGTENRLVGELVMGILEHSWLRDIDTQVLWGSRKVDMQ